MGCTSSAGASDAASKNQTDDQKLKTAQTVEAAGIMAETVTDDAKNTWKNARAQKKFKSLDADGSGALE